ncbi:MAG: hypothetical protein HY318_10875 [Armatimonadetes bacterium]|nr:hypothetical protein [Armatimonadota bacterium]
MQRCQWFHAGLVLSVVVSILVGVSFAQAPAQKGTRKSVTATGNLTEVNTARKTITVESKRAPQTFTLTSKTRFFKEEAGALSDIVSGKQIRVLGKVSADQSSIDAKAIVTIPEGAKGPRGKGIGKSFVAGTAEKTGDTISVQTKDGKKVTVNTTDRTKVARASKASAEDLKVGQRVLVRGTSPENGSIVISVNILSGSGGLKGHGRGGKGKGKAGDAG